MKCTLVPALSRTSILPQWKVFAYTHCMLYLKMKQDQVEKIQDIALTQLPKQNHGVFLTKFTLNQNTQCPFSTTPFIWNTRTVTCMLITLIIIYINSKKCQTSFGRNSVWSCKQVILEDPFLKQKKEQTNKKYKSSEIILGVQTWQPLIKGNWKTQEKMGRAYKDYKKTLYGIEVQLMVKNG